MSVSHLTFAGPHADGKLCVFVYAAGLWDSVWEKPLSMVGIDEGEIRKLGGLG